MAEWLGRSLSAAADTTIDSVKSKNGPVAEWLGRSLQNFVQRFKSARDLQIKAFEIFSDAFFISYH